MVSTASATLFLVTECVFPLSGNQPGLLQWYILSICGKTCDQLTVSNHHCQTEVHVAIFILNSNVQLRCERRTVPLISQNGTKGLKSFVSISLSRALQLLCALRCIIESASSIKMLNNAPF